MLTIKSSLLLVILTLLSSCKFSKSAIEDALGIFTISYSEQAPTYLVNTPIAENVPKLTANSSATFSVSPALPSGLTLNPATGVISGTPTAVTAQSAYTIVGVSSPDSKTAVSVVVIKVNPEAPSDLDTSAYSFNLVKNIAMTEMTSTVSTDSPVTYTITPSLPTGLTLNSSTGTISGTPTAVYPLTNHTLAATNISGNMTIVLSFEVQDSAVTSLSYSATSSNYTINTLISANYPSITGGAATSFSVSPALPTGISLNTVSGLISGTPTALSGSTNYTVTASNSQGSASTTISIEVTGIAPSSLSYTSSSLDLTKDIAMSSLTPTVSGIVTGYTVEPSLPAGLSLNASTGVVSGTPTAVTSSAVYSFRANNGIGYSAFNVTIAVKDVAPSALSYSSPNVFTVGSAIATLSPTVTGTPASYAISSALPSGLSFNTSNGQISGTPSAVASTATYTVTATNTGGSTSFGVVITVNAVAPSSLTYSTNPATYTVGTAISNNVPSVTGTGISYSVSPPLPSGLSLNSSNGYITGTPTVAIDAANYTVTATNSGGSTTIAVNITITSGGTPPSNLSYFSGANTNTYTIGTAASHSPTITGVPTSYSISGTLPSGLSINTTTGVISGTPTATKTATTHTVTATNASGSTNVSITVNVQSKVGSLSYASGKILINGSTTLTASASGFYGSANVFTDVSNAIPAGFTLDSSTGAITGTGASTGIYGESLGSTIISAYSSADPGGAATASVSFSKVFTSTFGVLDKTQQVIDSNVKNIDGTLYGVFVNTNSITTSLYDMSYGSSFFFKDRGALKPGGVFESSTYIENAWVDLDGDGLEELLVLDSENQYIHLFGTSSNAGKFDYLSSTRLELEVISAKSKILIGDTDGDTTKDIIIAGMDKDTLGYGVQVLLNTSTSGDPSMEATISRYESGLLDKDSKLIPYTNLYSAFIVNDGDNDGSVELIFGEAKNESIYVFNELNLLDNKGKQATYTLSYTPKGEITSLGIADFDGDAKNEILVISESDIRAYETFADASSLGYTLKSISSATYTSISETFSKITAPINPTIMDFENDSKQELVLIDAITGFIYITTIDTTKGLMVYEQGVYATNLKNEKQPCLNPYEVSIETKTYSGLIGCSGFETSIISFHNVPLPAITSSDSSGGKAGGKGGSEGEKGGGVAIGQEVEESAATILE